MDNTFDIVQSTFANRINGMVIVKDNLPVLFKTVFKIQKHNVLAVSHQIDRFFVT
ncbi:hypothetical protein D3C72_1419470 [compost metagenome]